MFESRILDTLVYKESAIHLFHHHVDRTFEAYQFLNFSISKNEITSLYTQIQNDFLGKLNNDESLRLIFSNSVPVEYKAEVHKIKHLKNPVQLQIHLLQTNHSELFKYKWENREYWDQLLKLKPHYADDVLLINTFGHLVETTRFNIFVYNPAENVVYTPELNSGCLNGAYRRYALEKKQIELYENKNVALVEKNISLDEVYNYTLYVANSVRGVLKAELL